CVRSPYYDNDFYPYYFDYW
nr:immunoglobulin heavy chain junction region [Macaca mulatta]MOV52142.1 immunoglobulin heavy chain junction region [Macaca mulatta]